MKIVCLCVLLGCSFVYANDLAQENNNFIANLNQNEQMKEQIDTLKFDRKMERDSAEYGSKDYTQMLDQKVDQDVTGLQNTQEKIQRERENPWQ